MLKKIQKLLLITFCVLGLSFTMIPNAKAFYPENLYGDPNYVMASAHMGAAWYVRKDSLAKDLVKPFITPLLDAEYATLNSHPTSAEIEPKLIITPLLCSLIYFIAA